MGHYLIEVGYTPEAWNTQIDTEANVIDRISPAVKACGGKIECIYYAFGERDLIGVMDFKTPEDAAAFGLAVAASGALSMYRTTPLLSVDQGIASLRKAKAARKVYSPPTTVSLVEQRASKKTTARR
jgi:uncharacterized protein with GYD domain